MLIGGKEKLERMRDGREVYIGSERVGDVTRHPALRNAAETVARLYDLKADPAQRDVFSYEENGERFSAYFLRARDAEQLARRTRAHKALADSTFGLIGRTPDHVAGLITGINQSDREAPWAKFHGIVDGLLDRIPLPAAAGERG